jgi:hypothetical protein
MKMTRANLAHLGEEIYLVDMDDYKRGFYSNECQFEYVKCNNKAKKAAILSGNFESFEDASNSLEIEINTKNLVRSFYGKSDILLEDDVDDLQLKDENNLIIIDNCGELIALDDFDVFCYDDEFLIYWNGNGFTYDEIENLEDEVEYELLEDIEHSPACYFEKKITIDGDIINISTSNTSGSITPYWTKKNQ